MDSELESAFVHFFMRNNPTVDFDSFVEIVTVEVATRGHLRCRFCHLDMRQHVLRAMRSQQLDHQFEARLQ